MNYRHAFHAGNFADVVKHALLARILVYLTKKDAPFLYLDTHAGVGRYDLSGAAATRTGEAQDGVGRMAAPLPEAAEPLLAPWRAALAAEQAQFGARVYPGSPALAQRLTRPGDRLLLNERHPEDARALRAATAGDRRVKTLELDGYLALNAAIPPKERRGVALIDPPFEEAGEIERMAGALAGAWRKWPGGIYALWAPIKDEAETRRLGTLAAAAGVRRILWIEAVVGAAPGVAPRGGGPPLIGTAMMVVNPPWTLEQEARTLAPALTQRLARGPGARWRVETLVGE